MKSVGIDIGSSSIKVVEVQTTAKGLQVLRFSEHVLGANPGFDPSIEIIEYLRTISSTYDQGVRMVFGLRQDQVSVRNKLFPFADRQKILKSLPFELEEDLPFSNETAVYDAKIIRTLGNSAEILACATPKNRVTDALQLMADGNIDVSVLSTEGIALANCFEAWDAPIPNMPAPSMEIDATVVQSKKISLQIYIGHTRTLVCAFDGPHIVGVRSILWGAKNIAEAIMKRYEIPYVEALKEMQTKAFILPSKEGASYDQIVFSDTISAQVKDLAKDIRISVLEFSTELQANIESVGLSGGASSILNLHAYLTQCLELPVNRISILAKFNTNFEKTPAIDSRIAIALGLAIEGLKKPRNPAVNFMRGEFAKQNTSMKLFWDRWATTAQIAVAAFVLFVVYSFVREDSSLSLADRTNEVLKSQAKAVAKLPAKSQNEAGVKKYIRDQKKRTAEMMTLAGLARMNSAMDVFKKINDSIPAKSAVTLDVRRLSINEDQVQIEGSVGDANQLQILEKAISGVATSRLSKGETITRVTKPGVQFSYVFSVDRGVSKSE